MAYLVFFQCPSHVVRTGAATFKIGEGIYAYVVPAAPRVSSG